MDLIAKFYDSDSEQLGNVSENKINDNKTGSNSVINVEEDNKTDNKAIKKNENLISNNIKTNETISLNPKKEIESDQRNNNENIQVEIVNDINKRLQTIECAPDVNVQDLVLQKDFEKFEKFNSGFFVPLKQNHLTGYINYHTMNDFNFNEQYYNFNAYGFAQDPTDFSGNRLIGDPTKFDNPNIPKSVFDNNKNTKECRKKIKMKRFKYGDAGSGEFMGPWAIYEGEEIFKNMSGELTEEQKEILKQIQEKKQKKLEEDKTQETTVMSVIK